jgi:DNA primase
MYLDGFAKRASQILFEYKEALRYLYGRGFTDEMIRKYQLGYMRIARIKKSKSSEYKSFYDRTYGFRALQKKILFPLRNILGRVHGLGVRSIEEKRYKFYFLNESKKIGAFFGLYRALPYIKKTRKVFVHEGAFDSMSFAEVFPNSVSSLTSFLNEQQYELLRFYADKIILVYDSDASGSYGIHKSFETYGGKYLDYIFIGEDDANTYLRMLGPEKFFRYIESKVPYLLRK